MDRRNLLMAPFGLLLAHGVAEMVAILRAPKRSSTEEIEGQISRLDAISMDPGLGVPVIKLGPDSTPADRDAAVRCLQNLYANEGVGVVLPRGWDFQYVTAANKADDEVRQALEACILKTAG